MGDVILELVAGVYGTLMLEVSFTWGVPCMPYAPAVSAENYPFPSNRPCQKLFRFLCNLNFL